MIDSLEKILEALSKKTPVELDHIMPCMRSSCISWNIALGRYSTEELEYIAGLIIRKVTAEWSLYKDKCFQSEIKWLSRLFKKTFLGKELSCDKIKGYFKHLRISAANAIEMKKLIAIERFMEMNWCQLSEWMQDSDRELARVLDEQFEKTLQEISKRHEKLRILVTEKEFDAKCGFPSVMGGIGIRARKVFMPRSSILDSEVDSINI